MALLAAFQQFANMQQMCIRFYEIHVEPCLRARHFLEIYNCLGRTVGTRGCPRNPNRLLIHRKRSVPRLTVVNWNEEHTGLCVAVCGGEAEIVGIRSSEVTDSSLCVPISRGAASVSSTTASERTGRKGLLWIRYFCESLASNSLNLIKGNKMQLL